MSKPAAWVTTMLVFLLLLIACAASASAQSSRGTLTVTLQVVPSTMLIFGEDGKAQLIEANGTNGLTVTTIAAPATSGSGMSAGVTRTDLSTTTTPQTPQVQGTPSN